MSADVMAKMQAIMPEVARQMPAIMGKVQAATAGLPLVRSYEDLSAAERAKLAQIMGVPETQLRPRARRK